MTLNTVTLSLIDQQTGKVINNIHDLENINLKNLGRQSSFHSDTLMVFTDSEKALLAAILWAIEHYGHCNQHCCEFQHILEKVIVIAMNEPQYGLPKGSRLEIRNSNGKLLTNGKHSIIRLINAYYSNKKNNIWLVWISIILIISSLLFSYIFWNRNRNSKNSSNIFV